MKIFLDTANLDEVKKAVEWRIIDGVTTNPSLIARERRPIEDQIRAICGLVNGDVSAAVVSTVADEMVREGRVLAAIHKNVVVKLPLTRDGVRVCSILSGEGVRCNVTLVFSAAQALLAAKAGAYFVSPFIGRLEDIGKNGIELIQTIGQIYSNYGYKTQILAASVRSINHVVQAAAAGAHSVTLPYKMIDSMFDHPLTDKGLEIFLRDWEKAFQEAPAGR